jgi:hypothetical protein
MFSDPQSVKFDNSTETSVPRINSGGGKSEYVNEDGTKRLSIGTITTKGDRKRATVRLDLSKITTDPYDTSQNVRVSTSAYLVVDYPEAGFTKEELKKLTEGLTTFLTASSGSAIKKALAEEN